VQILCVDLEGDLHVTGTDQQVRKWDANVQLRLCDRYSTISCTPLVHPSAEIPDGVASFA